MEWLAWWNLIYELPLLVGCMLSLASSLGSDAQSDGHHDVEHDVAADVDHDLDAGVDHDVDADAEVATDVGHDVTTDADGPSADGHADVHDADSNVPATTTTTSPAGAGAAGWLSTALAIPGADRAPVTLVLLVLCISFGFIGLFTNSLMSGILASGLLPLVSFPVATGGSLICSRTFARVFGRFLPKLETYVTSRCECVGRTGTVTALLSPGDGFAQIYDLHGNLLEVRVIAAEGEKFEQGSKILLVDYEEESGHYTASLFDPQADVGSSRSALAVPSPGGPAERAGKKSSRRRKERM